MAELLAIRGQLQAAYPLCDPIVRSLERAIFGVGALTLFRDELIKRATIDLGDEADAALLQQLAMPGAVTEPGTAANASPTPAPTPDRPPTRPHR